MLLKACTIKVPNKVDSLNYLLQNYCFTLFLANTAGAMCGKISRYQICFPRARLITKPLFLHN